MNFQVNLEFVAKAKNELNAYVDKIKENIPKGEITKIWHHKCDLHACGLFFSCQYALYLEKTPPNCNAMINLG